jgi:hypothetical protein
MGRGGAVGDVCEAGAWTLSEAACCAIAIVAPWIIVSARADKIINFIFMYIPQVIKSNY